MKVGRMRYRIIIQKPSDETDGFADPKDEWSDLAIIWADIVPVSGREYFAAEQNMVKRYNDIYKEQMPNITPHVCRHTYCSNMAKSGMNPKTLQYLMGHSDIGITLNTYTHLGLQDAKDEMERLKDAQKELDKDKVKELPATKTKFRIV